MSGKVLAIIELRWWGHHPSSFAKFIINAKKLGFRVLAFCPASREELAAEISTHDLEGVMVYKIPGLYELLENQPAWLRYFRVEGLWRWWKVRKYLLTADTRIDQVFFCMLDDFIVGWIPPVILDRLFPLTWSGLYLWPFRNDLQYGGDAPTFTPASQRWRFCKSRRCNHLYTIDEYFVREETQQNIDVYSDKWSHFPEYEEQLVVDSTIPLVRQIKEKAAGRKVIGLIGLMEVRKGIHTLLDVARQSHSKDWFFVFVGSSIEASREEFRYFSEKASQSGLENCFFHFDYLPSQTDFYSVMSTFDVVFLAYIRFFYPSGNLAYAALLKKPVIVTEGGVMARRVRDYQLGLVVQEDDVDDCIRAIEEITTQKWSSTDDSWDSYYSTQSQQALQDAFRQLL
jgi:glycosyltransferase involved in cell wall biosynthesis